MEYTPTTDDKEVATVEPVGFWSQFRHYASDALGSLRTRRRLLVEVTIVNAVMGLLLIFTPEPTMSASTIDAVWVAVMVFVHVMSFVLMFGALKVLLDERNETTLLQGMRYVLQHIIPLSILVLVWSGVFLVSLGLFILPALIVSVYGVFSFVTFMVEERRGVMAVVRSTELVYGRWWKTFALVFGIIGAVSLMLTIPLIGLIIGAGLIPSLIGSSLEIIAVIIIVLYAFLYEAVMLLVAVRLLINLHQSYATTAVSFAPSTITKLTAVYRTMAYVGWVVPGLVVLLGVWYVMQDPALIDRIILYFLTGV